MSTLDIRPLDPDDRDLFVTMVRAYLNEIAPELDPPAKDRIARFWTDDNRFAFTLQAPELCGFALITRLPKNVHELSEFYIAPTHRRAGLGRSFARSVVTRFPGPWRLGIAAGNPDAGAFWHATCAPFGPRRGPPLLPSHSASLHFTVPEVHA